MAEFEEGDTCPAPGCDGTLVFVADGDCSCHIAPPCHACVNSYLQCGRCKRRPTDSIPDDDLHACTCGARDRCSCDLDPSRLEPCTQEARQNGCLCSMESVNSASVDPPEPIVNPECPLHGSQRDPDLAFEAERDDAAFHSTWLDNEEY